MNYYIEVLKKYAVFNGRARRKEYWMFVLFSIIIGIVLRIIDNLIGLDEGSFTTVLLSSLYSLAVLIPSLAVSVRRLHDTNRSGWWLFISLVPFVGPIVLLMFLVTDSHPDENQYGPNPKEIKES